MKSNPQTPNANIPNIHNSGKKDILQEPTI